MAHPKRRHSNTRTNLRRSHDHLSIGALNTCPNCGKPKLAHRVCKFCGHYRGKQTVTIKSKEKKTKE